MGENDNTAVSAPLNIEKLVFGGSGLGFEDGRAIFVPYTAPGDRIFYKPFKKKRRFVKGRLTYVETPSDERVDPECPYFTRCGGCQWQHIGLPRQLYWKEEIFSSILVGKCGVSPERLLPVIPSPLEWNYRSRARLHVQFRKGSVLAGFFMPESHSVCTVEQCMLLDTRINTLLELASRHLFSGFELEKNGTRLEVILEAGDLGGTSIVVNSPSMRRKRKRDAKFVDALMPGASALAEASCLPVSVSLSGDGGTVLLSANRDCPQPPIIEPERGIYLKLPAGGFSQVNLGQNRNLVRLVKEAVGHGRANPERILDLFCGMGNFTLPLSFMCAEIVGVDYSSHSIDAARENCKENGITNASFVAGSVEGFVASRPDSIRGFDVVVLDPPRTGAKEAVKAICTAGIPLVVYVSCDPMTLARDMGFLLDAGYELRWSRPVDLFPHTYHIESVTVMELRRRCQ